jgi:hypothetical protein
VDPSGAGNASFRGLFGVYTVRAVTDDGMSLAGTCAFPRRGQREVEVVLD